MNIYIYIYTHIYIVVGRVWGSGVSRIKELDPRPKPLKCAEAPALPRAAPSRLQAGFRV